MNTRSPLPDATKCVYCGGPAGTNDHAPPKCFLRKPLPSNLITVPACTECNSGFSADENLVRNLIALVSPRPELVAERQPDGRVTRALARDARLRGLIDGCRRQDGNYELAGDVLTSFDRVLKKTVQGLYFGLYERFVPRDQLHLTLISDQRLTTPEQVVDQVRPPAFRDITEEPLPDITPSSWVVREPVYFVTLQPASGGEPVQRLFRLVRETPVDWVEFQPDVFRFGFVQAEDGRAVCVLDLWKTLVAAVSAPWPGNRGPLRKGRNNPLSRDGDSQSRTRRRL